MASMLEAQTISIAALSGSLKAYFTGDSSRSILPFVPRPLRFILFLLLLINCRSFPFNWHIRVFRPLLYLRAQYLLLSIIPTSRARAAAKRKFFDALQPISQSPFSLSTTFSSWASLDDCDYNFHLSNSSYAKALDASRLKFALYAGLTSFFQDGGWVAVGATHYNFLREIPIGRKYEVRMFLATWDRKWMYLVGRFISKGKPSKKAAKSENKEQAQNSASIPNTLSLIHTPSTSTSGVNTPIPQTGEKSTLDAINQFWPETEGEILHCVSISQLCLKVGRRTVPPALALAGSGCGISKEGWEDLHKLRAPRKRSSKSNENVGQSLSMRELLNGKWSEVPESERWWDTALAPYEAERLRRLDMVIGVREGIENAKDI